MLIKSIKEDLFWEEKTFHTFSYLRVKSKMQKEGPKLPGLLLGEDQRRRLLQGLAFLL